MDYAAKQPRKGDSVLHCGHFNAAQHNIIQVCSTDSPDGFPRKVEFTKADGSKLFVEWLVLCNACFFANPDDPFQAMRAEITWPTDDPIVQSETIH